MIAMPLYHFGSSFTFHAAAASSFSLVQVASRNKTTDSLATASLAGCGANSFLVYCAGHEGAENDLTDPVTSVPPLTWTTRRTAQAASSGDCLIATAPFPAGGNITASFTFTMGGGSPNCFGILYEFSNATFGISGSATAQAAPSVTVTTQAADSYLVMVTADWFANSGSVTFRDSATSRHQVYVVGAYCGYAYDKLTTSAGSYTEGISFPSAMSAGTCLLEVKST